MYQIIKKQTRPSETVEFCQPPNTPNLTDAYKMYFKDNYVANGKLLYTDRSPGDSNLELVITTLWESEAAFLAFKEDPIVISGFFEPVAAYLAEHGLEETLVSKGEV